MDDEIHLDIEKWQLKLDSQIKYVLSLEQNFTFILTQKSFYVHQANNDVLTQYKIPFSEEREELKESEEKEAKKDKKKDKDKVDNSRIWSDKSGNHVIFKLDNFIYYYNNSLPPNDKIKLLNLELNKNFLKPFSIAFNNNNKNLKYSDEIIFSDENSSIYTLTIKIEENGQIKENVNNVFSFITGNEENEFENNYFLIEKNDRIYDMKLFVYEEKVGTGRKAVINKSYFILAVSKSILFQFSGKNSIKEVFIKYKKETDILDKDELLKDCKIFPKSNIGLEKTRIQLFTLEAQKPHFYWNNECGFCQWPIGGSPLPFPQKEFTLYNYIKLKNDGIFEKSPCPLMCCQTSYCIYFLYKDCLAIFSTLTNKLIHTEFFKEEYLDIYYDKRMKKLILYSNSNIIKISIEHEQNNLWKNYIERGEYNLALQNYTLNDEKIKAKLHKLNGDLLFKRKYYDMAALEYGESDEDFEHICLKFLKLKDLNPLTTYLNYIKDYRLISNNNNNNNNKENMVNSNNNSDDFFIQKYLINTWLFELFLEAEDKKMKNKNYQPKDLKTITHDLKIVESEKYLDKLITFRLLQSYGRYKDYIDFAGNKNDIQTIIFDMVNHNRYKEAIETLIMYLSFDIDDKDYLPNLIKIFFTYINIFTKESPQEVIKIISKYYPLIEKPLDIIRIINNINIYDNDIYEENYDNILNLIKKLIDACQKSEKNYNESKKYNLSFRQNIYNLYILYLSLSNKKSLYNELLDFFKTLVNNSISKNLYYNLTLNNPIYFDFSFVQNILKKSRSALGLLYFLKQDYSRSVEMALSNDDKDTSIFIANSIVDPKKKKEVWLDIFNHYQEHNEIIEEILRESGGVLKILDILPYLMGNVHLKEIKNELKNCINTYESKLRKLRINIKDFGVSVDLLSQKVKKIPNKGQKSMKLKMEEINCAVCLKNLKELNFYLFPCKHAFDFDCLMNTLLYYDSKNIGDDFFKKKMIGIKQLINEIRQLNLRKKNIYEKKNSISQNQKKQNVVTEFFRSFTTGKNININNEDINFSINEENQLQDYEKVLDELLSQECPICGDEMILSTQIKFGEFFSGQRI